MARLLQTMQDVINRQLYEGFEAVVIPRGLSLPLDLFGTGDIRFGRKVGFQLPLIAPDNRFRLEETGIFNTDRVLVERDLDWVVVDAFVFVGERELHQILDIVDQTMIFTTPLLADHIEGTRVFHYSNPIEVEGAVLARSTIFNIDADSDSVRFIVRGDVIAIPTSVQRILSFREYSIVDLAFVGSSLVGGKTINQYTITVDPPIHRDLVDGEQIQMRAFPGYKSKVLSVPVAPSSIRRVSGPFLVDWVSAPLVTGLDPEETQTIQLFSDARTLIGPPTVINKNHLVLTQPIRADQFLFWDKVQGSINYDAGINRFLMLLDDAGEWWMKYTAVPNISVPQVFSRGTITVPDPFTFLDNEQIIIDDSEDVVVYEFQVTGGYVPTATAVATGSITVADIPSDNEFFTLDDGFGTVLTYEFQATGGYTQIPGTIRIDVQSAALLTDVAIAMETAINNATTLRIAASNVGPVLGLTHETISTKGNQVIVLDSLLTGDGWSSVGMAGGTNAVETIDITTATAALEVAQLIAAAINRTKTQVRANFPIGFPGFELTSLVPGPAGNIPIVETVADLSFIVTGMSGGGGGAKWNFQIKPINQDILLRIRLFPNDFQDYNITANTTASIIVALDPTDEPVERIDLVVKGTTAGEVQMTDWNINGPRVAAIQHEYVARVRGEVNYASTGIQIKQVFQSLDDVQARRDFGFKHDHGFIKL
jgi:hypothetical protein